MVRVDECELCPITNYRILNDDLTVYTGNLISIDSKKNVLVSTTTPFRSMPLWLEPYSAPADIDCSFLRTKKIRLNF